MQVGYDLPCGWAIVYADVVPVRSVLVVESPFRLLKHMQQGIAFSGRRFEPGANMPAGNDERV